MKKGIRNMEITPETTAVFVPKDVIKDSMRKIQIIGIK
jgi:hypothetical protein